jgi:hypothetical protein
MNVPFSVEDFLSVFEAYNLGVWPAQIVAMALAVVCLVLVIRRAPGSGSIIGLILSLLWLWMGIVYHILYFTTINKLAYLFGSLFILQGILFAHSALAQGGMKFRMRRSIPVVVGVAMIVYALLVYPILGTLAGHGYPKLPTFGLPCPTTIFTFGILLLVDGRIPRRLLVIPLLWSCLGAFAALRFGIIEDAGLLLSGILTVFSIWLQDHRSGSALIPHGSRISGPTA